MTDNEGRMEQANYDVGLDAVSDPYFWALVLVVFTMLAVVSV